MHAAKMNVGIFFWNIYWFATNLICSLNYLKEKGVQMHNQYVLLDAKV